MGAKLTAVEVAARLGISRRHVVRLIGMRDLAGVKTGEGRTAGYELDPDSVAAYLERNTVPASRADSVQPALVDVLGPIYTLGEVAALLKRSPEALEADARAGKFEHIKVGRDRRMTVAQVRQLIERATVRPGERIIAVPALDEDPRVAALRERVIRQQHRRAASAKRPAARSR
jgi:excisionase family DNA binding protein